LQRTEALWNVQVEKILYLEDIEMNYLSSPPFRHELSRRRNCHPTIQWYWECVIKSPFLKVLAVTTAVISFMVVWSEMTFFISHPVLSIFANILDFARGSYDFVTIELVSMATLCYLCYCSYSTIFRIKFLNLYYLAPHHQTNEHSLIFSGMLLCRLTPPMCLNFLSMMHMDSTVIKQHIVETFYTSVMGHMEVLGIISNGFNIYFPMLMVNLILILINLINKSYFIAGCNMWSDVVQSWLADPQCFWLPAVYGQR
jgi:LMBR1-like membrane protein